MSGHNCPGEDCPRCERRIAEREFPERLSRGEEARLDDWAERQMEANWP